MTTNRPSQQLLKEDISNLSKDFFADHCGVVATPSLDERIQILDEFNRYCQLNIEESSN